MNLLRPQLAKLDACGSVVKIVDWRTEGVAFETQIVACIEVEF